MYVVHKDMLELITRTLEQLRKHKHWFGFDTNRSKIISRSCVLEKISSIYDRFLCDSKGM